MVSNLRSHLRRHVVGYLALFVALSGTAYAVQVAPKNSVKSKSIVNGQVKKKDLAAGLVDLDLKVRIADDDDDATAQCQPGEVAVGGGVRAQKATANERITFLESAPVPSFTGAEPTGWQGRAIYESASEGATVRAYVICAS